MKPGISVLTLGVTDLERSVEFYSKGLGFATEGIVGQEFELGSVAFFELQNGLKLALWPRENIAKDTNLLDQDTSATGFTMGTMFRVKKRWILLCRRLRLRAPPLSNLP